MNITVDFDNVNEKNNHFLCNFFYEKDNNSYSVIKSNQFIDTNNRNLLDILSNIFFCEKYSDKNFNSIKLFNENNESEYILFHYQFNTETAEVVFFMFNQSSYTSEQIMDLCTGVEDYCIRIN